MNNRTGILKFLALLPLVLLIGCETTPDETAAPTPAKFPYVQMAPFGPPEPPFEYRQMPSDPMREIWRPGYWKFDGINYEWASGEFILRPSPASVWSAERWELRTYGWAFVPGYWQ